MNVLVIGGNRFMGLGLVWRMLCGSHRVTLLNRGNLPDPFGDRVERIRVDRSTDAFDHALAGRTFDRAIDFAGFSADDASRTARVLAGRVGHFVFISTGQVYLVREGCPLPAREDDYDGPTMTQAPSPADHEDWVYGIGKRGAEDVLATAAGLPTTRLRLPMVNGELDHKRRIEAYVWRILDGGPLVVPRAGAIARHVYSGAVIRAIRAAARCAAPRGAGVQPGAGRAADGTHADRADRRPARRAPGPRRAAGGDARGGRPVGACGVRRSRARGCR